MNIVKALDCKGRFAAVISPCLRSNQFNNSDATMEAQMLVTHSLSAEGHDASEDGTGLGTPLVPLAFDPRQITSPDNRSNPQPNGACHTLHEMVPAVAFQTRIARNGRGQPKDITDALTSSEGGTHADSKPHIAGPMGVRRLLPVECERLQAFPDGWTDVDGMADSLRYRMLGNAVVSNVAEWIGRRIIETCRDR